MQNPFQTGADANAGLNDPLNFVRKLWGDLQLPGMVTPTLSVDELDKQIRDLKTVESWLNLNLNMLRASIQALEVQRATITALKAMGESFSQQASATSTERKAENATSPVWPMHDAKVSEAQADAENLEADDAEGLADPEEGASSNAAESEVGATTAGAAQTAETQTEANFPNPAAWWNVLQEQFKHALGQALKDENDVGSARPQTPNASSKKSSSPAQNRATASAPPKGKAKSAASDKKKTAGSVQAVSKGTARSVTASKVKATAKVNPTRGGASKSSARIASKASKSV